MTPSEGSERRVAWQGAYLRAVVDGRWELVERVNCTGAVAILPVTVDDEIVLVEQHRAPVGGPVVELPAGLVGDEPGTEDEPLADAARRELLEETGYVPAEIAPVCQGVVSAGLSDERLALFLATGCRKEGAGGGDETEDIVVHAVPRRDVVRWLQRRQDAGVDVDVKAMMALLFLLAPPELGS